MSALTAVISALVGRGWGGRRDCSITHPNSRFLNDPELTVQGVGGKPMEKPCSNLQKMVACLIVQSEHDDSRICAGPICSDIRKVTIERHDCAALLNTDGRQFWIAYTA